MVRELNPFILVLGAAVMVACLAGCCKDDDNVVCPPLPADVEGVWVGTELESGICDGEPYEGEPVPWDATIDQVGTSIWMTTADGTFPGTVKGRVIVVSGSYDEDGSTTEFTTRLVVDRDGTSLAGTCEWTWTDGDTICTGTCEITAVLD